MSPNTVVPEPLQNCYCPKTSGTKKKEASELRKTMKPLMEKRRRARINESLNQLKTLILPLIGKDNSRYSKLEKADILEMTVRFLKELPRTQSMQNSSESYNDGYRACLQHLTHILPTCSSLDQDTCHRLLENLHKASELQRSKSPCHNCPCSPPASPVNLCQNAQAQVHLSQPQTSGSSCIVSSSSGSSSSTSQHFSRPQLSVLQQSNRPVWRPW
ncbi:transcription factor HES-2 [Protopterus annectens]|uniref:transcription factor HES-2 n=1 Tax=Protopterus annectens TaxID=7888 RepID=UPI001CF96D83|nr:transcription factor HES-2 [Protopterus annectens]